MFKVTEELEAVLNDIYSKLNSVTAQADTNAEMILSHESRISKLENPANNPYNIVGFANKATGGFGKEVISVSSVDQLVNSLGSNRTIVLDFSGIHKVDQRIKLEGLQNLTIEGNLIDPPMILRGDLSPDHTFVITDCENIVLNHFRIGGGHGNGYQRDSVSIFSGDLIALLNLSMLWGTDENLGVKNASNISVENCILAEGLLPHSEGSLVREYTDRINFYHCLFAHNYGRNPQISNLGQGIFDIRNCVMYNEGVGGLERGCLEFKKDANYNVVGNYYIAGPDKKPDRNHANACILGSVYLEGNKFEGVDRWLRTEDEPRISNTPFTVPEMTTVSADEALSSVLATVGPHNRNNFEQSIIDSVINRSGGIIANRPV